MEGFCIPAPVKNATLTLCPAVISLSTVIVTALVEAFTETAEALLNAVGVPAALATLILDVAMLEGTKVLNGKVTVIVPDPPVKAFCTVKFTVSVDAALTISGAKLTVMPVTAEVLEIV